MTHMHLLKKAILLSGVAMISFAATAKAGFEWKGPLEAPHAALEAPAAAPQAPDSDLAPVTSWSNDPALAPVAPAVSAPVESAPMMAAAPAAAPLAAAPSAEGDVLAGFGSGLPLVIALQQIVPPGYQYSFSAGVNPGVSVSWEGGKPWQQVLADTLATQGLGFRVQSNTVVIGSFSNDGAQVAPAPAAESAATAPLPADGMMSPAPDDMSPVAITSAPQTESAQSETAARPAAQTVTIHREKPSSLLERLGWKRDSAPEAEANVAVPRETVRAPETAPERIASAPQATPSSDAAPAPVAIPAASTSSWGGLKGQTLRDVLKSWSDKAGVELYWSIDYDYRLSDDIGYAGTYDEAVGGLLDKFAAVRPQPYGQLHQSASGPRVLVVKSYDLTR